MNEKKCPSCGAPVDINATVCKYCGEALSVQAPQYQAPPQYQAAPQYQAPQPQVSPSYYAPKNKAIATILAIFLGGLGAHKFYLGKIGQGILYLIFCWTYIPSIIGFIEGLIYLCSSEENFYKKYCKKLVRIQ